MKGITIMTSNKKILNWIRTCQECMHKQQDYPPPSKQSEYDKWAEHKCKACLSRSLNYGKDNSNSSIDFT